MTKDIVKVVIYARVSSEEQKKEGFSIPAQLDLLRDFARKNKFQIVKEFTESESAKQSGRKKFDEMVQFLKNSKDVKTILVEKTDRLYRNFYDYVNLDVDKTDYCVYLVKEGSILTPSSSSHEKFIHGLKVLLSKNFIDNLREETQKGRLRKAQEGYFIGQVPYGYKKLNPRKTILDERKAPFVKRAFELYATGMSLEKVREELFKEGFIYQPVHNKISKGQLAKLLQNINYVGVLKFRNVIYEGQHPPIISQELFDKAQLSFRKDNKPLYRDNHDFVFAGMMTCAECGCAITAEIKKGKYIYYHCTGGKCKCKQKSIYVSEEKLVSQFDNALKAVNLAQEHVDYIKLGLKESMKDKKEFSDDMKKNLQVEYQKIENRLDKLLVGYCDGTISTQQYNEKSIEWNKTLEDINIKLDALRVANQKYYDEGVKIIETLKSAYWLYKQQPNSEKRKMLNYLLSNCTLKGEKVSYDYNLPFSYFINFDSCREKYACRDSNAGPSA